MKNKPFVILLFSFILVTSAQAQQSLDAMVDRELATLVSTYKMLHAAPELSHYEVKTSAFFAAQLRALGYEVTENVGKFVQPNWKGYGVVAVMKNGDGPTVLVRTDLDALPVEEKTGLPYASTVKTKNDAGQDVSVMHACGHDIHITNMLGTAKMLAQLKEQWRGTLVLIGQPAEETIDGAKAMLADGLYSKIPKPDFAIALHDNAELEAGKVAYCPGFALANSTSVEITIRGLGGHGSKPEATKDPIVVAAQTIVALQTIVSRENSPLDPAVVTVGSIHGGAKSNIIPDEVKLLLTVRSYKEEVRQHILASIARITKNIAAAAGIPEDRAPIVKVSDTEVTPATYNDPKLTERLAGTFEKTLGANNVVKWPPIMGSEDFGNFSLDNQIPSCMFWLGAVEPAKVETSKKSGKPLPSLHSSLFEPLPEPTLRTGVKAMTAAVLELMKK
ncbi:MAG: peptidase M20 [Acidobacteria bacterium 13_1_40CM_3_55_6]|nr:MAG: peptidase M20 [Acidobacteria bacterium 13_1_40CM_3_55_6]